MVPAGAQQSSMSDVARKEVQRRANNVREAQKLVAEGDTFYELKKYKDAYDSYQRALSRIPFATAAKEMRAAIVERYAQAAIASSKQMSRIGKVGEAKEILKNVLSPTVAPDHGGVLTQMANLNSPIRTNPAATLEHTKKVEEVKHLLLGAQGYLELGQFDRALVMFEDVLRIDNHNKAAKRGMERVHRYKSDYYRAAYDETRARMLMMADELWELKPDTLSTDYQKLAKLGVMPTDRAQDVQSRMRRIIIPKFDVENAKLSAVVPLIRQLSVEYDTTTLDKKEKGINIVTSLGDDHLEEGARIADKKFTLTLRNIPLDKLLDYIGAQTGTTWDAGQYVVTLYPQGYKSTRMVSREFRVPPNFMADAGVGAGTAANSGDPFATDDPGTAPQKKLSVKDYLIKRGVEFPAGSRVQFLPATSTLFVTNNIDNINLVEQLVRDLAKDESVLVAVNFTVVDVLQDDLEELGYDWLVGNIQVDDKYTWTGGTVGNGSPVNPITGGGGPGNPLTRVDPLTSGLRSGDAKFIGDTIDDRVANSLGSNQVARADARAPGVFQVTGELNNSSVQMILRGLNQNKGISRIWKPSVVTRPGERAQVFAGRSFIYPTEYEPPELPQRVVAGAVPPRVPATPTAFEERNLGALIEVEPSVDDQKQYINLALSPQFVDFQGFINYGSPLLEFTPDPATGFPIASAASENNILMPVFPEIKMNTSVTLQDGATVAVGGLVKTQVQQVNDKVPILGDLPFVGRFFENNGSKLIKRSVVIFVKAELIDPTGRPWRTRVNP